MKLSLASLLPLGSALVAAVPLETRADVTTLTTTVYNNMKYYVQYAASAYCNSEAAVGAAVTCEGGCPDVMANNATILGILPTDTVFELEGYVSVDQVRKEVVLAFRGSATTRNWIADFLFALVSYSGCTGCYVHDGFISSWSEVKDTAFALVESALATYPGYTFVVTGHSLGAAVGTIAALELRDAGYACDLYTIGSPRVGNLPFVQYVTAQAGAEYRATHYDDPVPRLPPIVLGYFHTSPEYWLAAGPATNTAYTIADIEVCTGYANTSCNAGTGGLDGDAHSYYFQYVSCNLINGGVSLRRSLTARDDISDEELAQKLTNYTMLDIEYAQQLQANGTV